jgi:hypothetical protein
MLNFHCGDAQSVPTEEVACTLQLAGMRFTRLQLNLQMIHAMNTRQFF